MSLPAPTLTTDRLRLRPFEDSDAEALYRLHSDGTVLRYWDSPPWTGRDRVAGFLSTCRRLADDGVGTRLAVVRAADDALLGWTGISGWNPGFRSATLTFIFFESAWGQGYATEAATALLRWAYDTLDLNRVQAEADTCNAACARVLTKLGFRLEGTLREDCVVDGVVSDSWVFGLLRGELVAPRPQRS